MRRHIIALAAWGALAALPARAQFYDLDGTYRCVTAPDQTCAKADSDAPAAKPIVTEKETAAPSLADAIERVRKHVPTGADINLLEARAEAKDPRAVEVLAWCKLGGVGMKADALGAYWLYREAAELGVANARKNQVAVFERRLSSAERQQVLTRESAQ